MDRKPVAANDRLEPMLSRADPVTLKPKTGRHRISTSSKLVIPTWARHGSKSTHQSKLHYVGSGVVTSAWSRNSEHMRRLRTKPTNAGQIALDLLLPPWYDGKLRNSESKTTAFVKRWGMVPTINRENWDKYKNGKSDRAY